MMFFVRTASVRDAEKVQKLLVETWHATYDSIYGRETVNEICENWHSRDTVNQNIESKQGEYIVADDGNQIGGMAFARAPNDKGSSQLRQLYVLPELQGQGIGADLLNEIEECYSEAKKMVVEVDPENLPAIGFYRHFGYVEAGKTTDCGGQGDNIEALIFEKHFR